MGSIFKLAFGAVGGWQSYLIAAGIGAFMAASASVWATSVYYTAANSKLQVQIADLKTASADNRAASAEVSLNQLQDGIKKISAAANRYSNFKTDLNGKLDSIAGDLKNVQMATPLPTDCKPSADRLRSLQSAVDATNNAFAVSGP